MEISNEKLLLALGRYLGTLCCCYYKGDYYDEQFIEEAMERTDLSQDEINYIMNKYGYIWID